MSKPIDPLTAAMLISQGLQFWATMSERLATGTITDADVEMMLKTLGDKAAAWQAQIDAKA